MLRVRRPRLVRKRYFVEKTREKAPLESRFSPLIEAILPLGIAIRKSANAVAGRANAFAMWANAIAAWEIAITNPAKAPPNARNCVRKRSERDRVVSNHDCNDSKRGGSTRLFKWRNQNRASQRTRDARVSGVQEPSQCLKAFRVPTSGGFFL